EPPTQSRSWELTDVGRLPEEAAGGALDLAALQSPADLEAIRRKPSVDTAQPSVGVFDESPGPRAQSHQIQAGISNEQRVVRPRDETDPALQTTLPRE